VAGGVVVLCFSIAAKVFLLATAGGAIARTWRSVVDAFRTMVSRGLHLKQISFAGYGAVAAAGGLNATVLAAVALKSAIEATTASGRAAADASGPNATSLASDPKANSNETIERPSGT
jgi:hypothetical protein